MTLWKGTDRRRKHHGACQKTGSAYRHSETPPMSTRMIRPAEKKCFVKSGHISQKPVVGTFFCTPLFWDLRKHKIPLSKLTA